MSDNEKFILLCITILAVIVLSIVMRRLAQVLTERWGRDQGLTANSFEFKKKEILTPNEMRKLEYPAPIPYHFKINVDGNVEVGDMRRYIKRDADMTLNMWRDRLDPHLSCVPYDVYERQLRLVGTSNAIVDRQRRTIERLQKEVDVARTDVRDLERCQERQSDTIRRQRERIDALVDQKSHLHNVIGQLRYELDLQRTPSHIWFSAPGVKECRCKAGKNHWASPLDFE
jgi:hypothetical protein